MFNVHGNAKLTRFNKDKRVHLIENFSYGNHHGKTYEYYENGNIKKITEYRDDVKNGEEKIYDINGDFLFKNIWEDGKINLRCIEQH